MGKFNFGVITVWEGEDESNGDGGLEAAQLVFRPGVESPLEMS